MQSYSQFSIKQNKYNDNHYDLYLFNEKVYQKHYEWQIKVLFVRISLIRCIFAEQVAPLR